MRFIKLKSSFSYPSTMFYDKTFNALEGYDIVICSKYFFVWVSLREFKLGNVAKYMMVLVITM